MMLRRATVLDLSAMSALHAASFEDAWSAEAFESLLAPPGTFAFVAIEVSSLASGFVLARVAADEAEILTLAVRPNVRRRGIGRALMQEAAACAHNMGAISMFLEVSEFNAQARGLYSALGFRAVGRRKGYYEGRNGLVLTAELPLSAPALGKRP